MHDFHLSLFSITKYNTIDDDIIVPTMTVETLEPISCLANGNPQHDEANLEQDVIDKNSSNNYGMTKDKEYYSVVRKDTDYIMVKDSFPDDTHSNVSIWHL
jgi:hypothetical protein